MADIMQHPVVELFDGGRQCQSVEFEVCRGRCELYSRAAGPGKYGNGQSFDVSISNVDGFRAKVKYQSGSTVKYQDVLIKDSSFRIGDSKFMVIGRRIGADRHHRHQIPRRAVRRSKRPLQHAADVDWCRCRIGSGDAVGCRLPKRFGS